MSTRATRPISIPTGPAPSKRRNTVQTITAVLTLMVLLGFVMVATVNLSKKSQTRHAPEGMSFNVLGSQTLLRDEATGTTYVQLTTVVCSVQPGTSVLGYVVTDTTIVTPMGNYLINPYLPAMDGIENGSTVIITARADDQRVTYIQTQGLDASGNPPAYIGNVDDLC